MKQQIKNNNEALNIKLFEVYVENNYNYIALEQKFLQNFNLINMSLIILRYVYLYQ